MLFRRQAFQVAVPLAPPTPAAAPFSPKSVATRLDDTHPDLDTPSPQVRDEDTLNELLLGLTFHQHIQSHYGRPPSTFLS